MKSIAHRQKLRVQARVGSQKFEMNRRKIEEETRKRGKNKRKRRYDSMNKIYLK